MVSRRPQKVMATEHVMPKFLKESGAWLRDQWILGKRA